MIARALSSGDAAVQSTERALREARQLLMAADGHAQAMAGLGAIELPPAATADAMQMRAIASLYLASTLEAAGLIEAADDLTRMVRSGVVRSDLGKATRMVVEFWEQRNDRADENERLALFGRLFGAPAGPVDSAGGLNTAFEEILLDLCDAIIKHADGEGSLRLRRAADQLAQNIAVVASDMVLMMAKDIIDSLQQAIAILNHPAVRAALMARTMWDSVAAIDRRLRRSVRPTLSHLRRGRAGMVVLSWLADSIEHAPGMARIDPDSPVLGAALDWVDETISIIEADHPGVPAGPPQHGSAQPSWHDLGR